MNSVTFRVRQNEFHSAMRLFQWAGLFSVRMFAFTVSCPIIAAAVIYVLTANRNTDAALVAAVTVFAIAAIFTVCFALIAAWLHARATARVPLHSLENRLAWTPEGVSLSSEKGESRLLWSDFFGYAVNSTMLLLYISRSQFIPVPRRALTEDQFRSLMGTIDTAGVPNWCRWH